MEFCLRIYYSSQRENHYGYVVGYEVHCVIIPDQTETIAVRIMCIFAVYQLHAEMKNILITCISLNI